jgi:LysR family transcriptional regulator, cys regulon transcriptional activator
MTGGNMKLQQIKYLLGIVKNDLNVSKTAESFYTSQPGVSRQIKLLEEELNVEIFERHGRQLTGLTPIGNKILKMASEVLDKVESIKCVAQEYANETNGSLTIATTHTQARYVLPKAIMSFTNKHRSVSFNLKQGNPYQVFEMVSKGEVDLSVASEAMDHFKNLITLPCYSWNRVILVKRDHPLVKELPLTLEDLSKYPLVTYENGFTGRYQLDKAFQDAGLEPNIMLTASDADIIKAYVKMELGVGIIASVAYDPNDDSDLVSIDASHLFEDCVTKIAFRKGVILRGYMYDFIELFAPHLTRNIVDAMLHEGSLSRESLPIPHV